MAGYRQWHASQPFTADLAAAGFTIADWRDVFVRLTPAAPTALILYIDSRWDGGVTSSAARRIRVAVKRFYTALTNDDPSVWIVYTDGTCMGNPASDSEVLQYLKDL